MVPSKIGFSTTEVLRAEIPEYLDKPHGEEYSVGVEKTASEIGTAR
jgi:hypothetical protein